MHMKKLQIRFMHRDLQYILNARYCYVGLRFGRVDVLFPLHHQSPTSSRNYIYVHGCLFTKLEKCYQYLFYKFLKAGSVRFESIKSCTSGRLIWSDDWDYRCTSRLNILNTLVEGERLNAWNQTHLVEATVAFHLSDHGIFIALQLPIRLQNK